MIQLDRLRLNGFKSFVDRTELDIASGLNGIVGPNGCGKSNLVEALRWVMGETSAKRMRGDGMEDVIFAGTDKRSARNIAEVSILLDNSTRSGPAAYNGDDEIEIIRKIERDHGSTYKVNGKTVRARDVQMLLADTVMGANSPAMVSQGRITQIINAKPMERRLILEESAGISGLYARRHEAELRLRAADNNLNRLEDMMGSMESRLASLKKQARQAARYSNLSAQIRQLEILIAWLEWKELESKYKASERRFSEAESLTAAKLKTVSQLTQTQTTQSAEINPLREAEANIAAGLQAQRIEYQRLKDEQERIAQDIENTRSQITQNETDLLHESESLKENNEAIKRIETEIESLVSNQENDETLAREKLAAKEELEANVLALEADYNQLMESTAELRARKKAAHQRLGQNEIRLLTLQARFEEDQKKLLSLEDISDKQAQEEQLKSDIDKHHKEIEAQDNLIKDIKSQIESSLKELDQAQGNFNQKQSTLAGLEKQISVLEDFLSADTQEFTTILNILKTDDGFEKALSRALGDSLSASLDEQAPSFWVKRNIKTLPALPDGAAALSDYVEEAPAELGLALSQIGFVQSDENAKAKASELQPGQSLVTRSGSYFRWDGFVVKSDAQDRNAQFLEQKNKLKALKAEYPQAQAELEQEREKVEAIKAMRAALNQTLSETQDIIKSKQYTLADTRIGFAKISEEIGHIKLQRGDLEKHTQLAKDDITALTDEIKNDQDTVHKLEQDSEDDKQEKLEALHQKLIAARDSLSEAVRAFDLHAQEQRTRKARLQALADERITLQNRIIRSTEREKELKHRLSALQEKFVSLQSKPKSYEADNQKFLDTISEIEAKRTNAADKLAEKETALHETNEALKHAERTLSSAREDRAASHATLSALNEQISALEQNITEQFDSTPAELKSHITMNVDLDEGLEKLASFKHDKEKAVRDRDAIGPVNLRADQEAADLEKEVGTIIFERNDLIEAIEELRKGIATINKEARVRLIAAFDHVNGHFQNLFKRLFNGGKAHIELIDSDDPLQAGLEIFAQPPGKALQSLSLLSGGEQTMASICLIFSMFLTNPSPICVLDEIDAPLDDANVDRVCDLLDEIAERGETRFVIITHHRLTMARMDRLYGVTMAEKGVSQLVSIDLQQSFKFLDEAA